MPARRKEVAWLLLNVPAIRRAALCIWPSQFDASCADADGAAVSRKAAGTRIGSDAMNRASGAVMVEAAGEISAAEVMAVV